jgi:hypothetical protein
MVLSGEQLGGRFAPALRFVVAQKRAMIEEKAQ